MCQQGESQVNRVKDAFCGEFLIVARCLSLILFQLLWYCSLAEMNLMPGGEEEHFGFLLLVELLIDFLNGVHYPLCLRERRVSGHEQQGGFLLCSDMVWSMCCG